MRGQRNGAVSQDDLQDWNFARRHQAERCWRLAASCNSAHPLSALLRLPAPMRSSASGLQQGVAARKLPMQRGLGPSAVARC